MVIIQFLIPIRNIIILPWDRKQNPEGPIWLRERKNGEQTRWVQHAPDLAEACRSFADLTETTFREAGISVRYLPEPNGFVGLAISRKDGNLFTERFGHKIPEEKTFCLHPRFLLERADAETAAVCGRLCEDLYQVYAEKDYIPGEPAWAVIPLGDNIHECASCGWPLTDREQPDPVEQLQSGRRADGKLYCMKCACRLGLLPFAFG